MVMTCHDEDPKTGDRSLAAWQQALNTRNRSQKQDQLLCTIDRCGYSPSSPDHRPQQAVSTRSSQPRSQRLPPRPRSRARPRRQGSRRNPPSRRCARAGQHACTCRSSSCPSSSSLHLCHALFRTCCEVHSLAQAVFSQKRSLERMNAYK